MMNRVKKTRQTRQYIQLAEAAKKSMLTAIDNFNRVHGDYKAETTLILITNAWELLGKAVLVKKKKSIHKDRTKKETISCEKTINQLVAIKELHESQAQLLQQIVSLRNRCVHDVLPSIPEEIQHHLLFFGCKFFKELAVKHFAKLDKELSSNFLTLSFDHMTTYAAEVQKMISKLRRGSQGEKELVWLLERGIQYVDSSEYISQKEFEKLYKNKKKIAPYLKIAEHLGTVDMVRVVPVQAPQNYTADVTLRKGPKKLNDSLPVTIKKSNPDDDYPYFTGDIAREIGKPRNTNFVAKTMNDLGLKGNDEFHRSVKASKKSSVQKYSVAALSYIKNYLKNNPDYNPHKKEAS